MKHCAAYCLVLAFLFSPAFAQAEEGKSKFSLSAGYNYSTGDYGQTETTEVHYAPVTGKWTCGPWTAKVVVPYISITGPGVVAGDVPVGPARPKATESGLGDILSSVSWKKGVGKSGTALELAAIAKLPTADEDRHLGTGLFDYTLQAGLIQPFGKAYATGHVGRKFNGSNASFPLTDVWKTTLGAGYRLTPATTAGAIYDYREGQTRNGDPLSLLTAYVSHDIDEKWTAQLYASAGFTDGSPDTNIGLQVSYGFGLF